MKGKSVRSRDGGWGRKTLVMHCLLAAATLRVPCPGEAGVREQLLMQEEIATADSDLRDKGRRHRGARWSSRRVTAPWGRGHRCGSLGKRQSLVAAMGGTHWLTCTSERRTVDIARGEYPSQADGARH